MERRPMMKKSIAAFILAVFLSVTLSAAEAAPGKKVYPNPAQQQSQQRSRLAAQKPRPSAPRPSMQHAKPVHQRQTIQRPKSVSPRQTMQQPKPVSQRHVSPRQTMQQPKPVSQRQSVQRPRPVSQRPTMQQPRPVSQRQTVQQPKPVSQRQTVQRAKPVSQRQTMYQPKHTEVSREKQRPKAHDPKPNIARPKTHDRKQSVAEPKVHDPKKEAAKPKIHEPKRHAPRPKMHEQGQNVSKQATHRPEYRKHSKPGPRKDLHRPPVHRTHENMHVWRRAPKPPKDHWWNHRPAHRRGRYRGYYNGIYYTDVLSALLVAEVIHSTYAAEPASVIYYAEDSTRPFIPKEAIKYKGHHYQVFSDIGKTMEDAQQFCEFMGGHLAAVGDDEMNERMYRLINDSGYDNEYFEKFGHYRMIPNEPVTYVKADQESNVEEDEVFYGLYYWNYKNLTDDGTTDGTGGNAFVCEWDK